MVHLYYGDGKGKTTAAIGSAIRFIGSGGKVLFTSFLKNGDSSEIESLKAIKDIKCIFCEEKYNLFDNLDESKDKRLKDAYQKLFYKAEELSKDYGMIILDEFIDAIDFGYIDENYFKEALLKLNEKAEIIITGHTLKEEYLDLFDYISEIKCIKHPYQKGVKPRKGIEY